MQKPLPVKWPHYQGLTALPSPAGTETELLGRFKTEYRPGRGEDLFEETVYYSKNEIAKPHENTLPTWRWTLCLVGIFLAAFLYGLDSTVAASIQVSVYADLGHIERLPWIGLGFIMASASICLLVGKLYTVFNIRWTFCISALVFEVGSTVCGAAPTMNAMIVGRVIAGAGSCGMYQGALMYISIFGSPPRVPLLNSLLGAFWALGGILGPLVGGAFATSSATWRWAFYLNLPLMGVAAPIYLLLLPPFTFPSPLTVKEKLLSIDLVGAFLNAATITILLSVISFSGSLHPWKSAFSITLWIVWAFIITAFILQQKFCLFTTREKRLFPVEMLKSRTMVLLYICTGTAMCAYILALFYTPLFFQFTRADSAIKSSVRTLPLISSFVVMSALSGALLPRLQLYAAIYGLGGAFILIGGFLLVTIDATTPLSKIYGYGVLLAAGAGLTMQTGFSIAQAKVSLELKGRAVGFLLVGQLSTSALSHAMAGCVYQNVGFQSMKNELSAFGIPEHLFRLALGGRESGVLDTMPEKASEVAVGVIAHTVARVFALTGTAGAVMLICALLMRWERLEFKRN